MHRVLEMARPTAMVVDFRCSFESLYSHNICDLSNIHIVNDKTSRVDRRRANRVFTFAVVGYGAIPVFFGLACGAGSNSMGGDGFASLASLYP